MAADELEVAMVGGDQASAMGAGGEGDEHVEVKVAKLFGREAVPGVDGAEKLAGFDPIFLGGSEDAVIPGEGEEKFAFGGFGSAAPQFGEDNRRGADEATERVDALLVPAGAQVVDEDRCIEDEEISHRVRRREVFRRACASRP